MSGKPAGIEQHEGEISGKEAKERLPGTAGQNGRSLFQWDSGNELYEARYPIEQMRLVDDFAADDVWSATENNTSCFNYRLTTGRHRLSYHALGLAIDINPRYNPYVIYGDEGIRYCVPEEALPYADRDAAYPYKIAAGDLCCRLFRERGFRWGGDWTGHPDYMHFSKTEFAEES